MIECILSLCLETINETDKSEMRVFSRLFHTDTPAVALAKEQGEIMVCAVIVVVGTS